MKLVIDPQIASIFPHLCLGVVLGSNLRNDQYPQGLTDLIQQRSRDVQSQFANQKLSDDLRIASWRNAYMQMGVNPKKHTPTAEAFVSRAVKGKPLPKISAAVDAYLATELKYLLPIGGYDLDSLSGDVTLTIAKGGEPFEPLGGGASESVEPGEIIYRDVQRILTRRWNYRDANPTKITETTRNLILCVESVEPSYGDNYLRSVVEDTAVLLRQFCGGNVCTFVLAIQQAKELILPL